MPQPVITSEQSIVVAGHLMMAQEIRTVGKQMPALRRDVDAQAVHETRKAIRRTLTLFKLLTPYFAPGILEPHRRPLRGLMRRLGPCRDLAVLRQRLALYNESAVTPLLGLEAYWDERQAKANARLQAYLARKGVRNSLKKYRAFTRSEGEGRPTGKKAAPLRVGDVLPALVFQRIGAVRAYGAFLPDATPAQYHQLRIQFKELRYTLSYFADVLGEASSGVIELTRLIQDHLGYLNDTVVALQRLEEMECCADEAAIYGEHQRVVAAQLTAEFQALYAQFDRPDIRQALAVTLAAM